MIGRFMRNSRTILNRAAVGQAAVGQAAVGQAAVGRAASTILRDEFPSGIVVWGSDKCENYNFLIAVEARSDIEHTVSPSLMFAHANRFSTLSIEYDGLSAVPP